MKSKKKTTKQMNKNLQDFFHNRYLKANLYKLQRILVYVLGR